MPILLPADRNCSMRNVFSTGTARKALDEQNSTSGNSLIDLSWHGHVAAKYYLYFRVTRHLVETLFNSDYIR